MIKSVTGFKDESKKAKTKVSRQKRDKYEDTRLNKFYQSYREKRDKIIEDEQTS